MRYPILSKSRNWIFVPLTKIYPRNLDFKCFLKEVYSDILAENVSKGLFKAKPNRLAEDLRENHGNKKNTEKKQKVRISFFFAFCYSFLSFFCFFFAFFCLFLLLLTRRGLYHAGTKRNRREAPQARNAAGAKRRRRKGLQVRSAAGAKRSRREASQARSAAGA